MIINLAGPCGLRFIQSGTVTVTGTTPATVPITGGTPKLVCVGLPFGAGIFAHRDEASFHVFGRSDILTDLGTGSFTITPDGTSQTTGQYTYMIWG